MSDDFDSVFFFLFFLSSSDRPLRTVLSSVRASDGPGSVSAGTQASSVKSRPGLRASPRCVRSQRKVLEVLPIPSKRHLRVEPVPPKSANAEQC